MAGTASATNGTRKGAASGRRLPDGVSGMLVVGQLRHVAPSTYGDGKQLLLDVETISADGRVRIESVSGWLMESGEGAGFTALGNLYAGGHLANLVGQDVCLAVSARAAATKTGARLYVTCEGIWPLDESASGEV